MQRIKLEVIQIIYFYILSVILCDRVFFILTWENNIGFLYQPLCSIEVAHRHSVLLLLLNYF